MKVEYIHTFKSIGPITSLSRFFLIIKIHPLLLRYLYVSRNGWNSTLPTPRILQSYRFRHGHLVSQRLRLTYSRSIKTFNTGTIFFIPLLRFFFSLLLIQSTLGLFHHFPNFSFWQLFLTIKSMNTRRSNRINFYVSGVTNICARVT